MLEKWFLKKAHPVNSEKSMKRIKNTSILTLLLFSIMQVLYSQKEIIYKNNPVTLSEYLSGVMTGNLEYIAGQFNVTIAEAEFKASKVFPDPEVSVLFQ